MGLTVSKEQLMADAIENQDIDNLKAQIQSITDENMKVMCKSLVPGNANRCTLFHYATWQGKILVPVFQREHLSIKIPF